MKNALEPCWEARFESNSYGFRPGRSIHDAVKHCWLFLKGNGRRPWVLDADIRSAFDKISHEHIMRELGPIPGRELIRQWLKAGYVEAEIFHATESGTPQGGLISPCLLNIALNGLQQKLGSAFGYVRYADDLVVCSSSREQAEAAQSTIQEWLKPRGLELHPEKTKIVHINDGFNFLSFSFRRYRGKCLFKPQKDKVLTFLSRLRLWLNKHKQATTENVIRHLNPIIRGWANHYKHAVSKAVFSYVSHEIWKMLWKWCLRRHKEKGKHWVRKKYFGSHWSWRFQAKTKGEIIYLYDISLVKIERHVKVKGCASPDDPDLLGYWDNRKDVRNIRIRRAKVTIKTLLAELDARAD